MAGFDISLEFSSNQKSTIKNLCVYLQRIYRNHELAYIYRIKNSRKRKLDIYITIDGSLASMQHLDRKLPQILHDYFNINGHSKDIPVFTDYMKESRKRLHDLTDFVFKVANNFQGRPVLKTLSKKSLEQISKIKKDTKSKIRSRIVQICDDWNDYTIDTKSCVILLNQSMEDFIKLLLNEPKSSRIGFKDAIEKAFVNKIITSKERNKLLMYNKTRNRIQHRQGKTRDSVVDKMINTYIDIVEKHN